MSITEILVTSFWPLFLLLFLLLAIRQLRADVNPIAKVMVTTLASQAPRYAITWTFALLTATLASLQALQEVATNMHWVYIAAAAKILQPGLAVLVAYGRPSSPTPEPTPKS